MPLFIICIHHFLCIFQIFVFFLHFFICRNIMIRNFDLFISWLINMIWYFISWTQEQSLLFILISFVQFTQSCFTLCNPMDCSTTGFLSITNSRSLLKLMSVDSVMPSHHLILCHPLLLLPLIIPSIRVFSNESALLIGWPKYWSFSFSISPSNEHSGLISSRMDWLDLLAV